MHITFNYIIIENFGPFLGRHKFNLTNGSEGGLNFVRGDNRVEPRLGSNGAGKSKLLNALSWGLYGKTTDGLLSTDVRPWAAKGTTKVDIDVAMQYNDEGVKRRITRTAGPNNLLEDGCPVEQARIDRTVGMSFEVFRQTVMLGQGRPLFHDLTNSDKLRFLADVLDLDRWDRYSERTSEEVKALNRDLALVEGELTGIPAMLELLQKQVDQHTEAHSLWEEERAVKLENLQAEVTALKKSFGKAGKAYDAAAVTVDMKTAELKTIVSGVSKAERIYREARLTLSDTEAKAAALQGRLEEAKQQLADLRKSKTCPTCGGPIKDQALLLRNREAVEGKIADYMNEARKLGAKKAAGAVAEAKGALDNLCRDRDQMADGLPALEAEADFHYKSKTEVEVKLNHAKAALAEFEGGANPHSDALFNAKKALRKTRGNAETLEGRAKAVRYKVETTSFWVKAFKDVRLFILEDVLQELGFVTNGILDEIGLVGWDVQYTVERETKSGTIQRGLITTVVPRGGAQEEGFAGVKFGAWSGGESQRLRIAGALALSQVLLERAGVSCNIEVLDEPTRHLSSEGVDDLCQFLSARATMLGKTIWLVDHKAIESATFNNVITVVKDKKGSHLVNSTS